MTGVTIKSEVVQTKFFSYLIIKQKKIVIAYAFNSFILKILLFSLVKLC